MCTCLSLKWNILLLRSTICLATEHKTSSTTCTSQLPIAIRFFYTTSNSISQLTSPEHRVDSFFFECQALYTCQHICTLSRTQNNAITPHMWLCNKPLLVFQIAFEGCSEELIYLQVFRDVGQEWITDMKIFKQLFTVRGSLECIFLAGRENILIARVT